jgi:8-hydroxy-5-deazaflavin:NADPH oxidoreductase
VRIGIIGAGQIGQVLTRRLRRAGHDVAVANSRGPQSLAALARETGATAVSVEDAVRGRDLIVVTIQLKNVPNLPKGLFRHLPKALPVVDTCNYYPRTRDGRVEAIEDGMPESVWVEKQIGHPVVKAFNNIHAAKLMDGGRPSGAPDRIALPIAGDQPAAKVIVMRLVEELGFDAVDAGILAMSWRQQPATPVYCTDLNASAVHLALYQASPVRPPNFFATAHSPGTWDDPR